MDPKLQATYDKVMGTQTASQPSAAPAAATPPSAAANPMAPAASSTGPVIPPTDNPAAPPTPAYTQDNLNFQAAIQAPAATTPLANQAVIAPPQQKPSSLLKTLYVVGIIVFFVAYTFLWIKIFNLPLPF